MSLVGFVSLAIISFFKEGTGEKELLVGLPFLYFKGIGIDEIKKTQIIFNMLHIFSYNIGRSGTCRNRNT